MAAEPSGKSQGAEVLRAPARRDPHSVVRVSQVLLKAIATHTRLSLASFRRELGNAGYHVRKKRGRRRRAASADVKGVLIRVSGGAAAGCFRVWKTPKPRTKPRRPGSAVGGRSRGRTCVGPRGPRTPRVPRRAAKARGARRRSARARRVKPRAKDPVRPRAKVERRAKGRDERRGRSLKGNRPRARGEKKPREEKRRDPEKPGKRTTPQAASVRADLTAKSEGPRKAAAGNL